MFGFDENEGAKTFEGLGADLTDPGAGAEDNADVSLADCIFLTTSSNWSFDGIIWKPAVTKLSLMESIF